MRDLALAHRPKLIVAGATAYARRIDPAPFREIADEVGALLMFDAAHVAGLIAGGAHPNPVPYADVVTFTTHKTLRGPRGGAILCREEHAKKIDMAGLPRVSRAAPSSTPSPPRPWPSARPPQPGFADYAEQVVANSGAFGVGARRRGLPPRVGRHARTTWCWSTCASSTPS